MKHNELYIDCQCGCGVIKINNISPEEYEISIFKRSSHLLKTSLKERLRWIWHIITKGEVWDDYLILHTTDAVKIHSFLENRLCENLKINKKRKPKFQNESN